MTELPFRSALELAEEIRAKRIGCRELLELYWKRVERHNPALNAIIVIDSDAARRRADDARSLAIRNSVEAATRTSAPSYFWLA